MIHPHARDRITVCLKFAQMISDDRCVTSVHAHTTEIGQKHLPDSARIHHQKSQTILPEIAPSASSLAVIMVRQKRTTVDAAKLRLEAYPVHKLVKIVIPAVIMHIDLVQPVLFRHIQLTVHILFSAEKLSCCFDCTILLRCADQNGIFCAFSRRKHLFFEPECTTDLLSINLA